MKQGSLSVGERSKESADIVAAIDETDAGREYVIADISRDDSWISVPEQDTVSLNARR